MEPRKIKLTLSYDGTNYAGWQIQKNALSVEERLREALTTIDPSFSHLVAAGRTDSGVHALAQVVSFKTESAIPSERYAKALNTKLPPDIVVTKSEEVDDDFHARYSALGKHYSYRINRGEFLSPFEHRYAWLYSKEIDRDKLDFAAKFFTGVHDFSAFEKSGASVKNKIREIYTIQVKEDTNRLIFDFVGNGFLYNMVRILTGTMLEYATGRLADSATRSLMKSQSV